MYRKKFIKKYEKTVAKSVYQVYHIISMVKKIDDTSLYPQKQAVIDRDKNGGQDKCHLNWMKIMKAV